MYQFSPRFGVSVCESKRVCMCLFSSTKIERIKHFRETCNVPRHANAFFNSIELRKNEREEKKNEKLPNKHCSNRIQLKLNLTIENACCLFSNKFAAKMAFAFK